MLPLHLSARTPASAARAQSRKKGPRAGAPTAASAPEAPAPEPADSIPLSPGSPGRRLQEARGRWVSPRTRPAARQPLRAHPRRASAQGCAAAVPARLSPPHTLRSLPGRRTASHARWLRAAAAAALERPRRKPPPSRSSPGKAAPSAALPPGGRRPFPRAPGAPRSALPPPPQLGDPRGRGAAPTPGAGPRGSGGRWGAGGWGAAEGGTAPAEARGLRRRPAASPSGSAPQG